MNPYTEEVSCSVCGGPGMSTLRDAWFSPRHVDPSVCAEYLRRKRCKLDKERKEFEEAKANG